MKGTIRQRPGRPKDWWELRVYAGRDATGRDRQVSRVFRGGKREAQAALAELVVEVRAQRTRPRDRTLAAFAAEWLADKEALAANTRRTYRGALARHVLPVLGTTDLARVSTRAVDGLYRQLEREGVGAPAITQVHRILHALMSDAERYGLIGRNPVRLARPPRQRRQRRDLATIEQIHALIAAAEAIHPADHSFATAVRLTAATGLRRGELAGLQWGDLRGSVLRVRRAVVGTGAVVRPKTDSSVREIALDPATVDMLAEHRARMEARAAAGETTIGQRSFVFSSRLDGQRPWNPSSITHWWQRARDEAGVAPTVRFHDLRHWVTSALLDAGVSLPEVQRRMGHEPGSRVTTGVYGHAVAAADAAAALAIAERLHMDSPTRNGRATP